MRKTADDYLHELQQLARSRGGDCLSEAYINSATPLHWRCSADHEWEAAPDVIKKGHWCPACGVQQRVETMRRRKMGDMHAIAAKRGGRCLSDGYVSSRDKLEWECAQGHTWWAKPVAVQKGNWCRKCFYQSRTTTLEEVQAVARARGGRCLATRIETAGFMAEFECAVGHRWRANVNKVMSQSWCPTCGLQQAADNRRVYTFGRICAIVSAQGGRVCSPETAYTNTHSRVAIECGYGHRWHTEAKKIVGGNWCPQCARVKKKTLEDMQAIAQYHGGECLSLEYKNSAEKLRWQCHQGHQWEAKYTSAKQAWCSVCRKRAPQKRIAHNKYTIDTMRYVAYQRGWDVLSKHYINARTSMRWRCDHGHEVEMTPTSVMKNISCPECRPRTYTVSDMQSFAATKGGAFLSDTYQNSRTKHRWRCAHGHEWLATPGSILQGSRTGITPRLCVPNEKPCP